MLARAVEVFEDRDLQRAEAIILERYWILDDIRHLAALHLADDLQI